MPATVRACAIEQLERRAGCVEIVERENNGNTEALGYGRQIEAMPSEMADVEKLD